jgi:hypothetical protein
MALEIRHHGAGRAGLHAGERSVDNEEAGEEEEEEEEWSECVLLCFRKSLKCRGKSWKRV